MGRLQPYPMIHVSTGEEYSGSGTYSTQGLRPRHRPERRFHGHITTALMGLDESGTLNALSGKSFLKGKLLGQAKDG